MNILIQWHPFHNVRIWQNGNNIIHLGFQNVVYLRLLPKECFAIHTISARNLYSIQEAFWKNPCNVDYRVTCCAMNFTQYLQIYGVNQKHEQTHPIFVKRDTQCRNKHLHVQTYSMSKRIFIVILESIIHDIPMFVQHMRYFIVNGDEMGEIWKSDYCNCFTAHWVLQCTLKLYFYRFPNNQKLFIYFNAD